MAYTPGGVKVTKPSNTTGSSIKVTRSQADIASRNTGSIKTTGKRNPDGVKVGSPSVWGDVKTDGDSRGADHGSVKPTKRTTPNGREPETYETLGYGGDKNP